MGFACGVCWGNGGVRNEGRGAHATSVHTIEPFRAATGYGRFCRRHVGSGRQQRAGPFFPSSGSIAADVLPPLPSAPLFLWSPHLAPTKYPEGNFVLCHTGEMVVPYPPPHPSGPHIEIALCDALHTCSAWPSHRVRVVVVVSVVAHVEECLHQPRGEAIVTPPQGRSAVVVDCDVIAPRVASEQV